MNKPASFGEAPTRGETRVAICLLFCHPRKRIAYYLGLSEKTVDVHLYRLRIKYGVHRNCDLVRLLLE